MVRVARSFGVGPHAAIDVCVSNAEEDAREGCCSPLQCQLAAVHQHAQPPNLVKLKALAHTSPKHCCPQCCLE